MFEEKMVKVVPVGSRPVRIGRSPDNDLVRGQPRCFQRPRPRLLRFRTPGGGKTAAASMALS